MKHGADWYKREPRAVIDATRAAKLTALQAAIYNLILDLIYDGSGETPDDPAYISSHYSDVTADMARQAIADLVGLGKLRLLGKMLHNDRADVEAKSKQNLSRVRSKIGKTGGKNSGKARKNNDIEPIASNLLRADKIREDKRREERRKEEDASRLAGAKAPKSPLPSVAIREALGKVLDPPHVEAVLDHRRALRRPLTLRAAELLAGEFARARDGPNAAADAMVAHGWVGFKAEWTENQNGRRDNGGSGKTGTVAAFRTLRNLAEAGLAGGREPLSDCGEPRGREGGDGGTALVAAPSGRGSR